MVLARKLHTQNTVSAPSHSSAAVVSAKCCLLLLENPPEHCCVGNYCPFLSSSLRAVDRHLFIPLLFFAPLHSAKIPNVGKGIFHYFFWTVFSSERVFLLGNH